MRDDTTIALTDPAFADALSDLVRDGAQRIIKQAVQAELDAFLQAHAERDGDGRRAVVRNGYQPERDVLTGVGPVSVTLPKTRDRAGRGRRFSSALLPPYLKKTRRLESVLPWLYLKGVSTNDFDEALKALFGDKVRCDCRYQNEIVAGAKSMVVLARSTELVIGLDAGILHGGRTGAWVA